MIDEENTIRLNINVEQTIAKKKVRHLTETTKSKTKIPETVKLKAETIEAVKQEPGTSQALTTESGKTEAEKSLKQRSLMSTIRRILSIARKLCCYSGGHRRKRCKLQQDQTSN